MEKVTHVAQPIQADTLPISTNHAPQNQANPIEKKERTVEKEDLENAVLALNEFLKPMRRNLKFEFHDKLEKYYVKVVDSDTDQVIREIPPKKFLDMYAEMADSMGFLIDKKV